MTLFYPQTLKEFITTQIFIHQNSCQQANIQLFISFQKYNQIAACAKGIKIAQIALKSNSPNQPRAVKLHSVTLSLAFGRYKTNYTGTKCSEHLILVLNVFKKKKVSRLLYAKGILLQQYIFSIFKALDSILNSKRKQKLKQNKKTHKTLFAA